MRSKNSKKKWIIIGVILIMVITWSINRKKNGKETDYVVVEKGSIVEAVYGIGTITAQRTYQLKVALPSVVNAIYVQEGDHVRQGQPLIRLESDFIAPFPGVITSVSYKSGETVSPQSPILTLVDLTNRYVLVSLEQQGAIKIKPGQKAVLSFENLREKHFYGVVTTIFPRNGEFIVRINVTDLPNTILPGMTTDVAIQIGEKAHALLIPVTAISNGKVQVKNGLKTKEIEVGIGIVDGDKAEVVSGNLAAGDQLIIPKK